MDPKRRQRSSWTVKEVRGVSWTVHDTPRTTLPYIILSLNLNVFTSSWNRKYCNVAIYFETYLKLDKAAYVAEPFMIAPNFEFHLAPISRKGTQVPLNYALRYEQPKSPLVH